MKAFLCFVVILTARFPESQEIPQKILTPAEIKGHPLCFVVFLLENFCTVKKIPPMAFAPFATFCRSEGMCREAWNDVD